MKWVNTGKSERVQFVDYFVKICYNRGIMKTNTTQKLDPFIQNFLDGRMEANLGRSSIKNYKRSLTMFNDWCAEHSIKPESITKPQLREWAKGLRNLGIQPSTQSRHVALVGALYNHAHKDGLIRLNPAWKLSEAIPKVELEEPRIYTPNEIRAMLGAIQTELEERMLYSLLLTGCRAFELRKLRWQQSDMADCWVDSENQQLRIKGKGSKVRFVPIHGILMDKLYEWRQKDGHQQFVFVSGWGRGISSTTWQNTLDALIARAGIENPPSRPSHACRRTLNTSLTRANVRPDVLDAIFGWANTGIRTKFYTGRVGEDAHRAIALAYADDPVFKEQESFLTPKKPEPTDEMELLKLRIQVLELENENLRLKEAVAA